MHFYTSARILTALLLIMYGVIVPAASLPVRNMQRKHHTPVEAWSLCANVFDAKGEESFYALFFLSGKFFLMSGNYAHYSLLTLPSKHYSHESNTAVPPFKKVHHTYSALNETIGGHTIKSGTSADTLLITTGFKHLQSRFTIVSQKPPWTFKEIIGSNYDKRRFDWYLLPRCSVTVASNAEGAPHRSGYGHFQQFWGNKGEANCDWLVVHTSSGYEMTIAHFPDEKRDLPYLPGDYVLLSRPDGTSEKITAFTVTMSEWWNSTTSEKQYPLNYSVVTADHTITIAVTAFTAEQTKKIAGQEFWYGFGSVSGTIDGEKQLGWAYMAPLGKTSTAD